MSFRNAAIGLMEFFTNVRDNGYSSIVQFGDHRVHFLQLVALRIGLGFFTSRKTANKEILACGCLSRMVFTIFVTPLAIPAAGSVAELLVPIMMTNALGRNPSSSPFINRHKTCSVRSRRFKSWPACTLRKPYPRSTSFLPTPAVIESPTKTS